MQYLGEKRLVFFSLAIIFLSIFFLRPSWQVGGDGYGYYAYLRSIYFDHNLNFENEMRQFDEMYGTHTLESRATPIGRTGNPFAVGWSILYAPFFILALILSKLGNFSDTFSLLGYNFPFQFFIGLGTIFYSVWGLIFLYKTLRKIFSEASSQLVSAVMIFASPLIFYIIYEPSMAHGVSFFALSFLFYEAIKIYKKENISRKEAAILGIAACLSFLVRWQNLIFIVMPLLILYRKKAKISHFFIFLVPILTAVFLQIIFFKVLYGSFFVIPQGSGFLTFNFKIFQFLFSGYHGLFFWHPIFLLGVIGLVLSYKKDKFLFYVLSIPLMGQALINSGLSDWFGGSSFGSRRMVGSLFIFAYGLAFLFDFVKNKSKKICSKVLVAVLIILSGWNYILMIASSRGFLSLDKPLTAGEFFISAFSLILNILG